MPKLIKTTIFKDKDVAETQDFVLSAEETNEVLQQYFKERVDVLADNFLVFGEVKVKIKLFKIDEED